MVALNPKNPESRKGKILGAALSLNFGEWQRCQRRIVRNAAEVCLASALCVFWWEEELVGGRERNTKFKFF